MSANPRNDAWPRLVWGAILLTVGIIFWLDRIGRLDAHDYISFWPFTLIAIGVAHLPQRRWFAAAIWIVIGVLFLPQLGLAHLGVRRLIGLWPLLISVGGATLVMQALRPKPPGSMFYATAVMAGNTLLVGSQDFAGADCVAVMGGCELDLRGARTTAGEVTINVLAFWGGVDILVPPGWQVESRVSEILGGFEDKTVAARENAPRVIIRGSAIMGGVGVSTAGESV